jgi:hypothetical protein
MKHLVIFLGCVGLVFGLAGCQNGSKSNEAIDIIIAGGGKFPEHLVGKWKPDNAGWEFVFEPDGNISSAVIDSGLLRVHPLRERITTIPLIDGGMGTYELGKWMVQYSPADRVLTVEVVVEHYHLDLKTYGIKGQSTDLFIGPVSEDWQTWQAEWFTFQKVFALTPQPEELAFDANDNPKDTFIFKKQL